MKRGGLTEFFFRDLRVLHRCIEHASQAEIAETVSNAELAKVAEFFR